MKDFIYETMYILRPDMGEDDVDANVRKYEDMLKEAGAEMLDVQHRGKRRLAYMILKYREGIYIQMNYRAPGAAIAPMERAMRLSEDVIRYLTIKQEVRPEEPAEAEAVEA
jgi:small subunit ribosomal protein S6